MTYAILQADQRGNVMDTRYPQDLHRMLRPVDEALSRLRTEIQRGKRLLQEAEELKNRLDEGALRVGASLAPYRRA